MVLTAIVYMAQEVLLQERSFAPALQPLVHTISGGASILARLPTHFLRYQIIAVFRPQRDCCSCYIGQLSSRYHRVSGGRYTAFSETHATVPAPRPTPFSFSAGFPLTLNLAFGGFWCTSQHPRSRGPLRSGLYPLSPRFCRPWPLSDGQCNVSLSTSNHWSDVTSYRLRCFFAISSAPPSPPCHLCVVPMGGGGARDGLYEAPLATTKEGAPVIDGAHFRFQPLAIKASL
jgi:hypothetical protein